MHPVTQILYQRRAKGSLPGDRSDEWQVGIVVEGGGIHGIISGGMLTTFLDQGFAPACDVIYGISAGAFNSVYFHCPTSAVIYPQSASTFPRYSR